MNKTYRKIRINDKQRENLQKFSDFLLANNQECWGLDNVLTFGPLAGIEKKDGEDWLNYSYRNFVDIWLSGEHIQAWRWCFSPLWDSLEIDNSHVGVAKRVLILLEKGLPSDHENQMYGDVSKEY
jgi:hypothetical protein